MDLDAEVEAALSAGSSHGWESLTGSRRMIFAVSEAEVYCDKDGIDALIHRYGMQALSEFSAAFDAIGAVDVADALRAVQSSNCSEDALDKANQLIAGRIGYTYESLGRLVFASR